MHKVKMLAAVLVAGAVLANSGCGRGDGEGGAEPGTPSYCIQTLMKATKDGDVDLYMTVMPAQFTAHMKKSRPMMGDKFEPIMQKQLANTAASMEGARITGEKLNGDKATVTVTSPDGSTAEMPCIKEADGWKLDLNMGAAMHKGMPTR